MNWIKSLVAILLVSIALVLLNFFPTSTTYSNNADNDTMIDTVIFPHNEVVEVNIEIDEDVYKKINANATAEEVVVANITYNGYTFDNIGIRPKGNSSLRDVANSDSNRYSFKIDFNYYLEDQSFYGITKINLNNIFSDPSMMAEYLGYEMLVEIDAVSSKTTYVALSINDEYFGLYLAVEQVNGPFLIENYGDDSGELYKPEMGTGANLNYISDDGMDYTGLFPENMDDYNNESIVELMKTIEDGGDLDSILNVDSFLKYLAISTITIHQDSYQGGMYHNYYLYNNNGIFEWIAWDLNMIFNGFPMSSLSDEEATQFLIDEPVKGAIENYPLIEAIFENEEYIQQYHEYLQILSDGYLAEDNINEKILSIYNMIKDYVEKDPTSFYTYEQFETALFNDSGNNLGLLSFIEKRVDNVAQQLSGEIPSTNNGQGNSGFSSTGDKVDRNLPNNTERPAPIDGEVVQNPTDKIGERPVPVNGEVGEKPADMIGERSAIPADMNNKMIDTKGTSATSNSLTSIINNALLIIILISMVVLTFILSKKQN